MSKMNEDNPDVPRYERGVRPEDTHQLSPRNTSSMRDGNQAHGNVNEESFDEFTTDNDLEDSTGMEINPGEFIDESRIREKF